MNSQNCLPCIENARDPLEETRTLRRRSGIHSVVGDVLNLRHGGRQSPEIAQEKSAWKIADQRSAASARAIGCDGRQTLDVVKSRPKDMTFVNREYHAGQEHSIDEAFQNCRQAVVPYRVDKYERFRGEQTLDIGDDLSAVGDGVQVMIVGKSRHNGIETLGIEVQIVDLMAARAQSLANSNVQGV